MGSERVCSVCGQPAVVYVTFVAGQASESLAYCAEHAAAAGVLHEGAFALLGPKEGTVLARQDALEETQRCPACGFSLRDFEKTGRLGCPECFAAFEEHVRPLLKKLHVGSYHLGKFPRKAAAAHLLQTRIEHLEKRMKRAVAGERYEEAAAYRDKISEIRQLADLAE